MTMNFAEFEDVTPPGLPPDLDAMVRSEVGGGEKLRWVGQPRPGPRFGAAVPVALIGVFVAGFAVFWMVMAAAITGGGAVMVTGEAKFGLLGLIFPLFGIPILVIGLGMIASPFWAGRAASKTAYAVTDRRAILWEPTLWSGLQVRSYGPAQLGKMIRNQRPDGSGDLIFEEITTLGPRGRRAVTRRGFFAIDRVREVETLIHAIPAHD